MKIKKSWVGVHTVDGYPSACYGRPDDRRGWFPMTKTELKKIISISIHNFLGKFEPSRIHLKRLFDEGKLELQDEHGAIHTWVVFEVKGRFN